MWVCLEFINFHNSTNVFACRLSFPITRRKDLILIHLYLGIHCDLLPTEFMIPLTSAKGFLKMWMAWKKSK